MRIMITRRIVARALLGTTGVLAAVSLAACNGTATGSLSSSGGGQNTSTTQSTVRTTVANAPSQSDSASAGTAQAAGTSSAQVAGASTGSPATVTSKATPECKASGLKLSFGGGDAGMSQQEEVLRFTNVTKRSCLIFGFPGVSYVAGNNGTQVGLPAQRVGHIGARIVLAPGQVASTVLKLVDAGVFDSNVCQPTAVRGYRIYAPDDTAAMFIPLGNGAQGCAGNKLPDAQLTVVSVKRGLGNPNQP